MQKDLQGNPNEKKHWDYGDINFLIDQLHAGRTIKNIALYLGRSADACRKKFYSMCCNPPRLAPEQKKRLFELINRPAGLNEFLHDLQTASFVNLAILTTTNNISNASLSLLGLSETQIVRVNAMKKWLTGESVEQDEAQPSSPAMPDLTTGVNPDPELIEG